MDIVSSQLHFNGQLDIKLKKVFLKYGLPWEVQEIIHAPKHNNYYGSNTNKERGD